MIFKQVKPNTSALQHVAIIMDGNSRWAKANYLPRNEGHRQGARNVRTIAEKCADFGISYLTLFAFSTENWQRPKDEIDFLMKLLGDTLTKELDKFNERETRVQFIGDLTRFPEKIQQQLHDSVEKTAKNKSLVLTIALNYGGQWDLARAARMLAEQVRDGLIVPEDIDESAFEEALSTFPIPPPDLCIRTGGDRRISNFTLWDLAYTELYFSSHFWPDFSESDLLDAFGSYRQRERRFGARSSVLTT